MVLAIACSGATIASVGMAVAGVPAAEAASGITAPTGVQVTYAGPRSIELSWTASSNDTGDGDAVAYYVYEGSNIVATSMGTDVVVSSLEPSTSYTFAGP